MHNLNLLRNTVFSACIGCSLLLSGADETASAVSPLLLERARNGEVKAQLEAGFSYYKSNNPVRAAYWFNQAAAQGSPEAQYNIGRCCLAGYGVKKDPHLALEFFLLAAGQGLPPAQHEAAKLLLTGIAADPDSAPPRKEVKPDKQKAAELLESATAAKYLPSMLTYAEYLIKSSAAGDPQKIIDLLETAIKANDKRACIVLADFYLNRQDELRNEKYARELLTEAAKTLPEAMAKLAFAVENGYGAPPDPAKAFELYNKALDKLFVPLAAVRLANYFYTGKYSVRQDIPRALELYTRAAAEGVPEAITKLGICCKNGIGMPADKEKAFELLFQAAKMDHPPAQYELGRCFASGEGTTADQKGAFYWFNQAAMRGDVRALLESGKRYLEANGTEFDAAKAAAYLDMAYANGMTEALEPLMQARKLIENDTSVKPEPLPRFGL